MKSFVDFIQEDTNIPKSKEKDDEPKKEPKKSNHDPTDYDMKVIYGEDDYSKNEKQMHVAVTFGSKYEITYKTLDADDPTEWKVTFTKGFYNLKEKDKSEIENCLDTLSQSLFGFIGGELVWDQDPESILIRFKGLTPEVKKITKSWFNNNGLPIEREYKKEIYDPGGSSFFIDCDLKSNKG